MTLKNLVEQKMLVKLGTGGRDPYLMQNLGVSDADLTTIRSHERVIDRVFSATEILRERLIGKGVKEDDLSAQFTYTTLTALIDDGKYSPGNFKQLCIVVTRALRREYEGKRLKALRSTHLDIPYINFLREDFRISQKGNLVDAKRRWPKIKVSNYDWAKDTRLPLEYELGGLESTLLGVYFARARLTRGSHSKAITGIEIWGKSNDFEFYRNQLSGLIRKIHNQDVEVVDGKDKVRGPKSFSYNIPAIIFSSQAIATWLNGHWGLPYKRKNVKLPLDELSTDDQKIGFFKGILAADGRPHVYENRSLLRIHSEDKSYLEGVKELSETLGIAPRIQSPKGKGKQWRLDYSESKMVDMLRAGLFINQYHQQIVKPLIPSIVTLKSPKVDSSGPSSRFSKDELRCMAFLHNCHVSYGEIGVYFGFGPKDGIVYTLDAAKRAGFNARKPVKDSHHMLLKDAAKMYDKKMPPRREPASPQ